jgi:hypothetical protein
VLDPFFLSSCLRAWSERLRGSKPRRALRRYDSIVKRPILVFMLTVLAGGTAALLILGALFLGAPTFGRGTLLSCREGDAYLRLTDPGGVDMTLTLTVKRSGETQSAYVIDKSTYGTLRFVRDGGRVLVTNDGFIFAAYEPATGRIVPYDELEVTVWNGRGEVLDTHT